MPTTDEIRAAIREGTWPRVGLAADVQRLLEELDAANAKLDAVREMAQRWFDDRHHIGYDSSEQWQIGTEGNCGQAILDAIGEDQ